MQLSLESPVLVTGASGYLAGWIVKGLLDAGVSVHATVRDPSRKTEHLRELASDSPGELKLFAADLLDAGSFTAAMAGCRIVIHTASPFFRQVDDPQRDLVDPAVQGTQNVLDSVNATPSVQRMVLTSSVAAMYGDARDVAELPGGMLTEDAWNTTSSLEHEPYSYSKTLAERAAWRIAEAQQRWRLVVINPSVLLGPSLNPQPSSDSFGIVGQMIDGTGRFGLPRIGLSVVDVRDAAQAHIAAAFLPDAEGRHIVSAEDTDVVGLADRLMPTFGSQLPISRRALPKALGRSRRHLG